MFLGWGRVAAGVDSVYLAIPTIDIGVERCYRRVGVPAKNGLGIYTDI